MCMGCAGIAMMNSDGKAPDTTEAMLYFGLFALWILMLVHLKKNRTDVGAKTRSTPGQATASAKSGHALSA